MSSVGVGAKLGCAFNYTRYVLCWGRQNLGWVALAVSFSQFHLGRHLICCTNYGLNCHDDKQPVVWNLFLAGLGLLATAVEVSKSRHNLTIKLLTQNPPISFQDNTTLSLHCTFQSLIFSDHGDTRSDNYHMPPGLRPARHNYQEKQWQTNSNGLLVSFQSPPHLPLLSLNSHITIPLAIELNR